MNSEIELFMISGFLGAGKTTFLKHILTQFSNQSVGVVVNEFGSSGIDSRILERDGLEIAEIHNSSIFCSDMQREYLDILEKFLKQSVDVLFIEISGMQDASRMIYFLGQMELYLKRKPEITRKYRYCGSVCVVDAIHFLQHNKRFPIVDKQIRRSEFVVLNKTDVVKNKKQEEMVKRIHELNPDAYIYPTSYGKVPFAVLEENLKIWENNMEGNASEYKQVTYVLTMPQIETLGQIRNFCKYISPLTVRIKGFVRIRKEYGYVDCVEEDVSVEYISMDEIEGLKSELIVIGKGRFGIREELEIAWRDTISRTICIEEK